MARDIRPPERLLDPSCDAWGDCAEIAWGPERYRTSFKALWSSGALCLRFHCQDDRPWWTITERDGRLWNEEVVEIFLDPTRTGRAYAEVEISPANVVCDLRVDTPWPALSSDPKWDWTGLQTRVETQRADERTIWIATAILPFDGARSLSPHAARCVPSPGDRWHFNLFRIKRPGGATHPEQDAVYAAWSVPDGPSFHDTDRFRELVFAPVIPPASPPSAGPLTSRVPRRSVARTRP